MTNRANAMNFKGRLIRDIFFFEAKWCFIREMKVGNKCKISAQYLSNYACWPKNTGTWGVNTTLISLDISSLI